MSRPIRRTKAPRCRKCGGKVKRYEEQMEIFHVRQARDDGWPEAEGENVNGRIVGVFAVCGTCPNRWRLHNVATLNQVEAPAGSSGESEGTSNG